ncbi:MAG: hypothetical protein ACTSV2_05630 [Candidatus Thorarchaeota archaeon]
MSNTLPKKHKKETSIDDVEVYTRKLFKLNLHAQNAVREFALHNIDDKEGLEKKRICMHDAFTTLYDEVANFSEKIMGEDFDIGYLRGRIEQADGETKTQLETALTELQALSQQNLADIWMARVMAWVHQAAAASGPFVENEHEDKEMEASKKLARIYTMLERPFSAVAVKIDGTQKLRRVALGHKAYSLMSDSQAGETKELAAILGKNKTAEAEFFDEFLNELISNESTFRQAFNPFDELIWRDILSSFIFERATDLYNDSIPFYKKSKTVSKQNIETIKSWKNNTAGLSEVYLAMTYTDIADAQMRAGNLEDASKLYLHSSETFGRAEKRFASEINLQSNADQARLDKEHKLALSHFCKAESSIRSLTELLKVNNVQEAFIVLKEIFKDLRKAEKLAKERELTGAIRENLRIFSFVEGLLKKKPKDVTSISEQIAFAKDLRKEGLIQDVNKYLDTARQQLGDNPGDALEATKEALTSLGILLSLDMDDTDIGELRNKTLALLNNVKYVVQFQLSSQLQQGVKFILSRILENLHADEAASYYKVINEPETAAELTDLGKLALSTAFASEAQVFARQSEQWAFRTQVERSSTFKKLTEEIPDFEDAVPIDNALQAHDETILRIKHTVASFDAAAKELDSVAGEAVRKKNNVESQVKQLQGVVMKFTGDLLRLEGAKNDFMAEYHSLKGDKSKAGRLFDDAKDQLRAAVGSYTTAAQVFQQVGDTQAAQNVDSRAKTADLLARSFWDNRQRVSQDQEPTYKGEQELIILYMGGTGK